MIGDTNKLENSPGVSWSILIAFGSDFIYSAVSYTHLTLPTILLV